VGGQGLVEPTGEGGFDLVEGAQAEGEGDRDPRASGR